MVDCEQLYVEFLTTELQAYCAAASLAAMQYETGRLKAARQSQALAETGCATLRRYMTDPMQLIGEHRREVEAQMKGLQEALDRIAPHQPSGNV